ncbi:malto-oligosyltrehalose synthase [Roseomonas sp. SSH11]|uniref:Malto-oligosyltrehalose synthase n=1 Tax=Pararoseomonas baculiformis TaxID=2820812 RepID=A0ABS4AA48_9PROT|nr:malto-oligosyltrehalose synthase [Pararoseomonas baculiformis]MBP0443455.1 malto-oligosyltrehalose synthase [Pararoseomonas baculiformis]
MPAPATPRATARLQFHKDFPLDAAVPLVPYFAKLGISHLYASPLLKARPGSTHGYDIVDPDRINPELGGEEALERLVAALRAHDMGLILDIVPNHMGVGGADNGWWLDVLEWGAKSPFARFFDIDWNPPDPGLTDRMLAPFLGAPYGTVLESGDLALHFEPESGKIYAQYFEHRFPLAPRSYAMLLSATQEPQLAGLAQVFRALDVDGDRDAIRAAAGLALDMLAQHAKAPEGRAQVDSVIAAHDPRTEEGRARLHALLEVQNYRLAWWRAATDEINWRRFFDVTSLGGLQVERPQVFEATHRLILKLYADGLIDGVRVDHVDGLADPRGYCRKLRRRLEGLTARRPAHVPKGKPLLLIEKILAPHEKLRRDWMVDGTTGYNFMDEVSGVLHDPAGAEPLAATWHAMTGRPAAFEEEAREARRQILRYNLASELNGTSYALRRIAMRDLATRDFTLTAIRRALTEVLVHFPAYRSYLGIAGRSEADRRLLDWAMAGARRTIRETDRPLLELLDSWLGGDPPRGLPHGQRRERQRAAIRFQQLSAPVAAKSVEDTSFYRYGRLISRNEVGSEPSHFAETPAAFHADCRERAKYFPREMLATATHDHKRGEDTRARLAVISELPDEWAATLTRWTRLNSVLKKEVDGEPAPDATDEIMLYQSLIGAWPLELEPSDEEGVEVLVKRLAAWQEKALREGKRRSEWAVPNEPYEAACREFLTAMLANDRPSRLREEVAALVRRLSPAGAANGLAQTLIRCTAPGIPDLYQGTEFWDFSLVDPDNRRPVDFEARKAALEAGEAPAGLLPHWKDGRVKAAVIAHALALRTRQPELFAEGEYIPLEAEGEMAQHVLAFARRCRDTASITVVTRLPSRLLGDAADPLPPAAAWAGTALVLPPVLAGLSFRDALGGDGTASGERLEVADLLRQLPVALLATD